MWIHVFFEIFQSKSTALWCTKAHKRWKLAKFSQNLKNHWTNTRLVCTHLNAFFMLNPNMAMTIWILKFFDKFGQNWNIVCTRHPRVVERVKRLLTRMTLPCFYMNALVTEIFQSSWIGETKEWRFRLKTCGCFEKVQNIVLFIVCRLSNWNKKMVLIIIKLFKLEPILGLFWATNNAHKNCALLQKTGQLVTPFFSLENRTVTVQWKIQNAFLREKSSL